MGFDENFAALVCHPLAAKVDMVGHLTAYRPRYAWTRRAIESYLPKPTGRVLDVGCGYGVTLALLKDDGFTELLGIDLFTRQEDTFLAGVPNARIIPADLETAAALADVADESCNCVISSQVMEHLFNHPFGHLRECARVLHPGGVLLLDIPNPLTLANAWRMLSGRFDTWGDADFATLPKIGPDGRAATTWSIHYREYPPHVLRRLVDDLPGCRVLAAGYVGTAPRADDAVMKAWGKRLVRALGLRDTRLFGNVQWLVVQKDPTP